MSRDHSVKSSLFHQSRRQVLQAQRSLTINVRFPDAHHDKQLFWAQSNGMIQEDDPVVGRLFWAGQQIIPELLDPELDRVRRSRLEGHLQVLPDDGAAF